MTVVEDALGRVCLDVSQGVIEARLGTVTPLAVLIATGVSIGITVGLATGIDDIAAARALLRAIEHDVEQDDEPTHETRLHASSLLRAAVR